MRASMAQLNSRSMSDPAISSRRSIAVHQDLEPFLGEAQMIQKIDRLARQVQAGQLGVETRNARSDSEIVIRLRR
jgi:hypothetical protein